MFSAYLGASLLVLPICIYNVNINSLTVKMPQILSIVYLALIPTGIGFWLWNKGSITVKSSILAIMNNLKILLLLDF